jgi:hypothetical protein
MIMTNIKNKYGLTNDAMKDLWGRIYNEYYKLNGEPEYRGTVLGNKLKLFLNGNKEYDIHELAKALIKSPTVKNSVYYEMHEHYQIELTSSCDKGEAVAWMKGWMVDAVALGDGKANTNLRAMYLAAYETYMSLTA